MRDLFELATTVPHDEPCSQIGDPDYHISSRMEATAFINQLRRIHGLEPSKTKLKIIQCPHDFGTYLDVAVEYDDEHEESEAYMLKIESGIPSEWDDEAKKELAEKNYFQLIKKSSEIKELD